MTDSKAWSWEDVADLYWETPSNEYYYISKRWKDKKLDNLLDLGCGKGRHALAFAKDGFNVHACDLSQYAIDKLKKNVNNIYNINLQCCDMLELPYKDGCFDCIFSYHVISHTDQEGILKIIEEISRVLVVGGEIYFDLISADTKQFTDGSNKILSKNTYVMLEDGPEYGITHFVIQFDEIQSLLKNFEILDIEKKTTYNLNENKEFGTHYYILAKKR